MTLIQRDEAETRRLLDERAARLAAVPDVRIAGSERTLACFTLNGSHYAIDAAHLLGISGLGNCVPIPGTPPHIVGLISQRGRLLTLIDPRPMLDLPILPRAPDAAPQMMILAVDKAVVGVQIDALLGVFTVRSGTIGPAPELLNTLSAEVVGGVVTIEDHNAVLIDLPRLVSNAQWIVDDSIT